jgi:hypothetical protein
MRISYRFDRINVEGSVAVPADGRGSLTQPYGVARVIDLAPSHIRNGGRIEGEEAHFRGKREAGRPADAGERGAP